jgi:hypothetical protein
MPTEAKQTFNSFFKEKVGERTLSGEQLTTEFIKNIIDEWEKEPKPDRINKCGEFIDHIWLYENGNTKYRKTFNNKGELIGEQWRNEDGVLHRLNKPAYIKYENGKIIEKYYYSYNDCKKIICYYENGNIKLKSEFKGNIKTIENYDEDGKLHDDSGPAYCKLKRSNGENICKKWYTHGVMTKQVRQIKAEETTIVKDGVLEVSTKEID